MSEPTQTTYEEATRCPSCEWPGRLINKRRAKSQDALPGTMVELFECRNDRCGNFVGAELLPNGETIPADRNRWFVQINPNGTVPPKGSGATGPKAFEAANPHTEASVRARDRIRLLAAQDEMDTGQAHEIASDLRYRGGY